MEGGRDPRLDGRGAGILIVERIDVIADDNVVTGAGGRGHDRRARTLDTRRPEPFTRRAGVAPQRVAATGALVGHPVRTELPEGPRGRLMGFVVRAALGCLHRHRAIGSPTTT